MMVHINRLIKKYNESTVLNINELKISKGQVVGVVGNNGQGKSTLFKLILDLILPTNGSVLINGLNVKQSDDWKAYTGAFLDQSFLIDFLTPEEYFDFIAHLNKIPTIEISKRLSRFCLFFNNEILGTNKYISDFSTGNQSKIGIAASFLGNPSLVILDEPFAHLDPLSVSFLKTFIKEYAISHHATFLISSHQLDTISSISDRIIVLEKGKILGDMIKDSISLTDLYKMIGT